MTGEPGELIVAIGHGKNAGSQRNLRTGEAAIVARAVHTLVVRPDERDDGTECGNPPRMRSAW